MKALPTERSRCGRIIRVFGNKRQYLPLLLMADEQEDMIDRYLERGEVYVLETDGRADAVCVVTDEGEGTFELKNLAVAPDCRGTGLGRRMVDFVRLHYKQRGHTLLVGTGDSPMTVPFYEKCGFVRSHVIVDFFTEHYDHPIVEEGVLLRDMVYFKMNI